MWQAPEVISNPGNCSKPGDVYSFGIILWEFLMMRRPWQGTPLMFIQHLVQGGKRPEVPADLSEVPTPRPGEVLWGVEEYVRLMRRCWDADPEERPNFEHVVEELESIEKGANARMCAAPPPPYCPLCRCKRRRPSTLPHPVTFQQLARCVHAVLDPRGSVVGHAVGPGESGYVALDHAASCTHGSWPSFRSIRECCCGCRQPLSAATCNGMEHNGGADTLLARLERVPTARRRLNSGCVPGRRC